MCAKTGLTAFAVFAHFLRLSAPSACLCRICTNDTILQTDELTAEIQTLYYEFANRSKFCSRSGKVFFKAFMSEMVKASLFISEQMFSTEVILVDRLSALRDSTQHAPKICFSIQTWNRS